MSDIKELVERLRALKIMDEVGSDNPLGKDAAFTIEAQAAEIGRLMAVCKKRLSKKSYNSLRDTASAMEAIGDGPALTMLLNWYDETRATAAIVDCALEESK